MFYISQLPRMFSMNQARYATVIFLCGLCKFAISTTATTCQFSIENFPKTRHERSPLHPKKNSLHVQYKTTIQRDDGLRIYYFAYMNSPPLFRVPSILCSCYSNYELKREVRPVVPPSNTDFTNLVHRSQQRAY